MTFIPKVIHHVSPNSLIWETQAQSLGWEDALEKEWQPTPALLPGESHAQRSPVRYTPWGHKVSDTTGQLTQTQTPYELVGSAHAKQI